MENTEKATPFEFDDGLYGRETKPVPKEEKNIGIDTQDVLLDNIVGLAENNILDITAIENFTNTARNRNSIYNIIDTMGDDSVISSVLEAYTEDATEYNDEGRIVWVESDDDKIGQYIDFLLRSLQVDKHIFKWAYCLIKYGDVYLRLYRKSEYDNIKFENKKAKLEEGVVVKAFSKNDKFAHYVDMVANPANVFELTKYGKTYGYIVTSNSEAVQKNDGFFNTMYSFTMKQANVDLYDAQEFVHGCMEDNISRVQEVVNLEMNSEDGVESDGGTTFKYDVRKGQSLLYNTFKVWRQLKLLEDSVLLNRITKSSILRVIEVQVGDMAKESVANHLMNIKQKIEQKTAIDNNVSMNEYNNPGPIENNIYVPVRGEKGSINTKQIGGDVDVKSLADLDYFTNSLFGSLRVPKQFFGFCLRGDTLIPLLNGETVSIEQMFNNKDSYIGKGILACNEEGSLVPTKIKNVMLTKTNADFIRIHLDNGKFVDVTPEHRMMMRDGSFVEAKDIVVGDRLMPYYEKFVRGRKHVLDNKEGKYKPLFHIVANKDGNKYEKGTQIHHIDFNKRNDDFDNLVPLTIQEHYDVHFESLHDYARKANKKRKENNEHNKCYGWRKVTNGEWEQWLKPGEEIPEGFHLGGKKRSDETRKRMSKSRLAVLEKHPEYKSLGGFKKGEASEETLRKIAEGKKAYFDNMTPEERQAHTEFRRSVINSNRDTLVKAKTAKLEKTNPDSVRYYRTLRCPYCGNTFVKKMNNPDYADYLNKGHLYYCCNEHFSEIDGSGKLARSYNLFINSDRDLNKYEFNRCNGEKRKDQYFKPDMLMSRLQYIDNYVPECNHSVVGIEHIDVSENAYDIEVEDSCHTFALDCGIFVHNCEDAAGFNGGTSLAVMSSRYAKTIKRIQNVLIQMITDVINIMLLDSGLNSYVGKFQIKMLPPTTQEELDRRSNLKDKVSYISDIMNLLSDIDSADTKLEIVKSLLSGVISDPDVISLIQEEIEKMEEEGATVDDTADEEQRGDIGDINIGINDRRDTEEPSFGEPTEEPEQSAEPEEGSAREVILPSPEDLGIDMVDNNNQEL